MWAVGCVSYVSNVNELIECDNRKFSDKIMTYICFGHL